MEGAVENVGARAAEHASEKASVGETAGSESQTAEPRGLRGAVAVILREIDPMIWLSLAPIGVYWLTRQTLGTQAGISAGFVTALAVFWVMRGRSVLAWLALVGIVVVAGASAVGLVLNSDKAYLANDPVSDFLMAAIMLGSLVPRRPLMGLLITQIAPRVRDTLAGGHRVFYLLTAIWAVQNLVLGTVRVAMLQELSPGQYLLGSRAVSWPLGVGLTVLSTYLIYRAMRLAFADADAAAA